MIKVLKGSIWTALVALTLLWANRAAVAQPVAVFTHEVDVLDEFISRFNNQDSLLFQAYPKANRKRNFSESRGFLIKSLFDFSSKNWHTEDVKTFMRTVSDTSSPVYLNFTDNNWYAELVCSITYKGKPEKANLILRFEEKSNGSRWAIAGVKAPFLQHYRDSVPPIPTRIDETRGLNPASHGNDFISLYRAFDDAANIRSYLVHEQLTRDMQYFIRAFLKKQMTLVQIDRVTYHFLQVDGWIFTVNNYPHRKTNAGWLINQLMPANSALKQQYKTKILNIN